MLRWYEGDETGAKRPRSFKRSAQNYDRVASRACLARSSAWSGDYKYSDSTMGRERLLMRGMITKTRKQDDGHDGALESLSEPFGIKDSCFLAPSPGGFPTSKLDFCDSEVV